MGLLKQFFNQGPEKFEQKGDRFVDDRFFGHAKLEYEKALDALKRTAPDQVDVKTRLHEKLQKTKDALALDHKQTGEDLMETGHHEEARELFELAIDLSQDEALISTVRRHLSEIQNLRVETNQAVVPEYHLSTPVEDVSTYPVSDDEAFTALCATLPEKVLRAYVSYGPSFKSGYLALNRGEFDMAADELSRALDENPTPDSYISLELATAYLNLGKLDEALPLLDAFLQYHPDALPGYQVLCEVLWEMEAFDQAEKRLDGCPEELRQSVAYYLLRGETMSRAGNLSEAILFYQGFMEQYGWNDTVAKALAGTFEALGDLEKARALYADIMSQCGSCGTPVDPFIKRRFADVSFDLGQRSSAVLEIYLSLAQEDPENTAYYYDRVSRLYATMGYDEEARRFKGFAMRAERERGGLQS